MYTMNPEKQQEHMLLVQLFDALAAKSPKLYEIVMLCAIPIEFNHELLFALRASTDGKSDGLEPKILANIQRLSFVHVDEVHQYTGQLGATHGLVYSYSPEARMLLLHRWQQERTQFIEINRRALRYYEAKLKYLPDNTNYTIIEEIRQSILYHQLAVDADKGIALLRNLFRDANEEYQLAAAEKYVEIAKEQRYLLSPQQSLYVDYMEGRLYQISERWDESRRYFEGLLVLEAEAPGTLGDDLVARTKRALAATLSNDEDWNAAIVLGEEALAAFRLLDDKAEMAFTMIVLGQTYRQVALKTWGGEPVFHILRPTNYQFTSMMGFVVRIPLVIYLIVQLGLKPLLPVLHIIGSGMDWVIARLFALSAHWFQQAEELLIEVNDREGVLQVREELGALHLTLNNPRQSEKVWHNILDEHTDELGQYEVARAKLGLAAALVAQRKLADSNPLLLEVLPMFKFYNHQRRIAETHMLLAQCYARSAENDKAVTHYAAAIDACQQDGNIASMTDIVHQLEELQLCCSLSPETTATLDKAIATLPQRQYSVRYTHPFISRFQRYQLIILLVLFFLNLFFAIRTSSGSEISTNAPLIRPIQMQMQDQDVFSPRVELTIEQQLRPVLNTQFLVWGVVWSFSAYLLTYTLLGLYFLVRTPLSTVRSTRQETLLIDDDGIEQIRSSTGYHPDGSAMQSSRRMRWADIDTVLIGNRMIHRWPLPMLSSFILLDDNRNGITVSGNTRYYNGVFNFVLARLNLPTFALPQFPMPTLKDTTQTARPVRKTFSWRSLWLQHHHNRRYSRQSPAGEMGEVENSIDVQEYGFSVIGSKSGAFMLASLLYLIIFIGIALFAPSLTRQPWPRIGYSLADLYGLAYFGMEAVLLYWVVFKWVRTHLFLRPSSDLIWAVGGSGVLICIFHLQWSFDDNVLDIATPTFSLMTLVLLMATGIYVATARWRDADEPYGYFASRYKVIPGTYVYQRHTRFLVGLITLALSLLTIIVLLQEIASFHFMVQGNRYLWFAEQSILGTLPMETTEHADDYYERAADNYERSLSARNSSVVFNSLGSVKAQLGDYEAAVSLYHNALELNPEEYVYFSNIALAYDKWAADSNDLVEANELYEKSLTYFNDSIANMETNLSRYGSQLLDIYLLRGGILYGRQQLSDAIADYEQVIQFDMSETVDVPDEKLAAAYTGRGWSHVQMRTQVERNAVIDVLNVAQRDFNRSIHLHPEQVSAYSGHSWSEYYLALQYPHCRAWAAEGDGAASMTYMRHIEKAIESQSAVLAREPTSAYNYRVRAQFKYLLRHCDPDYDYIDQHLAAAQDYSRAIALDANRSIWYQRRGLLYFVAGQKLQEAADAERDMVEDKEGYGLYYDRSIRDLTTAIALDPLNTQYWSDLDAIHKHIGLDHTATVDAILEATAVELDSVMENRSLAEQAQMEEAYALAVAALQRAMTKIDLQNDDANQQRFELWLAQGQVYSEAEQYEDAILALSSALEIDPSNFEATLMLGWAYYHADEYRTALAFASHAAGLDPLSYDAHYLWANTFFAINEEGDARKTARRAFDLAETLSQFQDLLRFFDVIGATQDAVTVAETVLDMPLTKAEMLDLVEFLWRVPSSANAHDLAVRATEQLLAQAMTVNDYKTLTRILLNADEFELAIDVATQGTELMLNTPEESGGANPLWLLGWWAYEARHFELAAEASLLSIQQQPLALSPYINRGLAYVAAGDVEAAQQSYDEAIAFFDQLEDERVRMNKYNEGVNDLHDIIADPEGVAEMFIALLEMARDQ
ncbi:MAG: tetratricopeptide repeat protein [Chloroflexota bacterium]